MGEPLIITFIVNVNSSASGGLVWKPIKCDSK